jgi:hypothetical protein
VSETMDDPDADFTVANSVRARLSGKFREKQALHLGGVYGQKLYLANDCCWSKAGGYQIPYFESHMPQCPAGFTKP